MKSRTITFAQAARLSGLPEEELWSAFKDGLIVASKLENTGVYHLSEAELDRYLRRSRKLDLSEFAPIRRVLIVDEDLRYAESLRLFLQRDRRVEARLATWGKDAVALLHEYKPHLCLLGWRAPDDRVSRVLDALRLRGVQRSTRLLAYGGNTTMVGLDEDADGLLESVGIPALLSKARGTGALVEACYPVLGLEPPAGGRGL